MGESKHHPSHGPPPTVPYDGPGEVPILIVAWSLVGIALSAVAARLYLRLKIQKRKLLASDYFILVALVSGTVVSASSTVLGELGALDPDVGSDMSGFAGDPEDIPEIFKVFWLNLIPVLLTQYFSKGALLLMYLNVFAAFMPKRRIMLWVTIVYHGLACVASILVLLCICQPLHTLWHMRPGATCSLVQAVIIFRVTWTLNIFADLLVLILPCLILPELTVQRSLKVAVYFLFALGLATISFAILRFTCVTMSLVGVAVPMSTPMLWGTLECNMGLVIACLPGLAPYLSMSSGKAKEQQMPELKSARLDNHPHDAESLQVGTVSDLGTEDGSRRGRSERSASTAGLVWRDLSNV
ncbi:hypothetical protein B0T10DRAFT_563044 [Thelonectria olida]|uniref:Rhodopsin domain-containing protein n=1 Tax=Thelonectria olida TaxID=1576542 RepID=A0A9P8W1P9_9HYPO|nr:hypothetical protein B0T10DRAFT_563044 [Thelonectria olida]